MKPQITTIITTVLLLIGSLSNCKTLETRIEIKAETNQTWQNIKDFESYSKWNPFIKRIDKLDDETLEVELLTENGDTWVFNPTVVKNQPNHYIWRGRLLMPGIFTGEHEFKVIKHPTKEGVTVFLHNERFSGILVPFFGFDSTERSFNKMNKALKTKLESSRQ